MHELYPNAKCADLVSMRFIEHSFVSFQCSSCIFATRKFSRVRRFLARAFRVCPAESHLCCRTASLQEWTGNSTCNRLQQLQKRQCGRRLAVGISDRIFREYFHDFPCPGSHSFKRHGVRHSSTIWRCASWLAFESLEFLLNMMEFYGNVSSVQAFIAQASSLLL